MSLRLLAVAVISLSAVVEAHASEPGPPSGGGTYEDFVALFQEFDAAKPPQPWNANFNDPDAPNHGLVDYSKKAVKDRIAALKKLRVRLEDMNVVDWPRSKQSEWLAVRAAFDEQEFLLTVSRMWARDPGFYVDQLQRFAFEDLPLEGDKLASFRRELAAVPHIVEQAKATLDDVAGDYARLAIRNLTMSDGVGHGHPYRATPPAGVIGWYEDLLARAKEKQPELAPDIEAALAAARNYRAWVETNLPRFKGKTGVGAARYDWYLKHAKLLPYNGDEMILLGDREWERLSAWYALERNKNRKLPELAPSGSAAEYKKRIAEVDKNIRDFLVREEILTIPDYMGTLDTNAPFIERPGGLNFWEKVQFRDPHPDHLHAVIPGHRFDGLVEDHNTHPIRGKISDGVRIEGWGVYLEEAMMQAGVVDKRPRAKELIYLFGIFRAARVPADVRMQRNDLTVDDAVEFMIDKSPWLDANVARVDAEIYLRRPPGYGIGYTIGAMQLRELLAECRNQAGDSFTLKAFHDDLLSRGRLPVSLLRWEMTGLDDEVREFWKREAIPSD